MNTSLALAFVLVAQPAPEAPTPPLKDSVKNGLKWLAEQQQEDGRWVGRADSQPTGTTAMAGLALMMEGSTLKNGEYAPNIRKAVAWIEKQAKDRGSIVADHQTDSARPVLAHAHALLFLACAYDVDDDLERRGRLQKILDRAIVYAGEVQTTSGGWTQFEPRRATGTDDPTTTVQMLHALLTARRVGLEVPRKLTDKAVQGLGTLLTTRFRAGQPGRPLRISTLESILLSGAAATAITYECRGSKLSLRWDDYLRTDSIPMWPRRGTATSVSAHLELARVRFLLGEAGQRSLDPTAKPAETLKWSEYRDTAYQAIQAAQSLEGGWIDTVPGPVYGSSVALIILQLENDYVPAFSR